METVDGLEALELAAHEFTRRLATVGDQNWSRPTPCDEWDVRALVNHVVGGNVRYTLLLHGAAAEEVAATRSADQLRPDAASASALTLAAVTDAFKEPGARSRTVHHPSGDRSGEELLWLRVLELGVHGWDLARAIGSDETLDPHLVAFLLWGQPSLLDRASREGFFSPAGSEVTEDVAPQAELLRRTGRRP